MPPHLFSILALSTFLSLGPISTPKIIVDSMIESAKDYQIVSAYDEINKSLIVKFYLDESASIGLELYNQNGTMLKVWQPQIANQGQYLSSLELIEIPDGTYLLNVIINEEMYQQAVFKY